MGSPQLTANSPSAGSISWSAFKLSYLGAEFTFPAGSTSATCVWWKAPTTFPAAGSTQVGTLQTGSAFPALTDDDLALFVNRSGTPFNVQNTNIVDGSLAVTGSIAGDAIIANSITGSRIQADSLTAREIAAGSITASELGISGLADGISINGEFEDWLPDGSMPAGWTANAENTGSGGTVSRLSPGLAGGSSMRVTVPVNSGTSQISRGIPVRPGQEYAITATFQPSASGNNNQYVRVLFGTSEGFTRTQLVAATPSLRNVSLVDSNGSGYTTSVGAGAGYVDLLGNWTAPSNAVAYTVSGQATVPPGATWMKVSLYTWTAASAGYFTDWDLVQVQPVIISSYIGDGVIATRHVLANSITANKLNVIPGGGNLWSNSSFESTAVAWPQNTDGTGTPGRTANGGRRGGAYITVTKTGAAGTTYLYQGAGPYPPVEAGRAYSASAYVRSATTARTATCTIQWLDINGGGIATSDSAQFPTTTTGWTRITMTGTAPAGAVAARIIVYFYNVAVGETHWTDDWQFEEGDVASGWSPQVDEILPGTVTASHVAAGSITSDRLYSGSVEANRIQASNVAAGAITANKLAVIVGGGNTFPNSSFEDPSTNWAGTGAIALNRVTTTAYQGTASLQAVITGPTDGSFYSAVVSFSTQTVKPGETWTWSVWIQNKPAEVTPVVTGSTGAPGPMLQVETRSDGWARYATTWTNNTGADVNEGIYIWCQAIPSGQSRTYYIDALQYERGDVRTAWAPKPDEILPGTIVSSMISAGTIESDRLYSGAVEAKRIQASNIAAGQITANKLNVTVGGGNLVPNSSFEADSNGDGLADYWSQYVSNTGSATFSLSTTGASLTGPGTKVQRIVGSLTATTQQRIGVMQGGNSTGTGGIPVKGGVPYTVSCYFAGATAFNTGVRVYVDYYDVNGTNVGTLSSGYVAATVGRQRVTATNTSPASAAFARVYAWAEANYATGYDFNIDGFQLEEGDVVTAYSPKTDEILPGTIVAPMVAAGTLTSDKLYSGSVEASRIQASNIAAGAITANKLSVIAGGGNIVADSGFESNTTASWTLSGTAGSYGVGSCQDLFGSTRLLYIASGGADAYAYQTTPVLTAGVTYVASAWVRLVSGAVSSSSGRLLSVHLPSTGQFFAADSSPNPMTDLQGNPLTGATIAQGVWRRIMIKFTPSAATTATIRLQGSSNANAIYWDNIQLEEGDLPTAWSPRADEILPGTIVSSMVQAGTIESDRLYSGTVDAKRIQATNVAAGAITANKLNVIAGSGNLFYNSTFQARSNTSDSGAAGWGAYNNGGTGLTSIARATDVVRRPGVASIKLVVTSNNGTKGIYSIGNTTYTMQPDGTTWTVDNSMYWRTGRTYVATWWTYQTPSAGQNPIAFDTYHNGTGGATAELCEIIEGGPSVAAGKWQRWRKVFRNVQSDYADGFYISIINGVNWAGTFWISEPQIEEGDVPTGHAPRTDELLPGSIAATHLQADSVTAGAIKAGEVTAGKIAAGAVTTEKLTVATISDQVLLNNSFEELTSTDATLPAQWFRGGWSGWSGTIQSDGSQAMSGSRSAALIATAGQAPSICSIPQVPVVEGERWYISAMVKATVNTGGGLYIRLLDQNGAESNQSIENRALNTTWVKYEGQFVIPAGMKTARVFVLWHSPSANNVAGTVYVDNVTMYKVTVSAQIADGAVKAEKIEAGAITATNGKIASIDANVITTGTLDVTGRIAANAITGDKIRANEIIARHIRSREIQADHIAVGAISADKISVGARAPRADPARAGLTLRGFKNPTASGNPTDAAGFAAWFMAPQGQFDTAVPWNGNIDFAGSDAAFANYAWEFDGFIYLDRAGTWQFGMDHDDGAEIEVNGTIVTSYYGGYGKTGGVAHSGSINIPAAGYYQFRARVQNGGGAYGLTCWMAAPGYGWTLIGPTNTRYAQSSDAVGGVSAVLIQDGAITAAKISADAIDGRTITGNTINGATITGGTLRTMSGGAKVSISSAAVNQIQFDTQHTSPNTAYQDTSPRIYSGTYYPSDGSLNITSGAAANMQTALILNSGSMFNNPPRESTLILYGAAEDNGQEMFTKLTTDRIELWAVRTEVRHSNYSTGGGTSVQGLRVGPNLSFPFNMGRIVHTETTVGGSVGNLHIDTYGGKGGAYINWMSGFHLYVGNGTQGGYGNVYGASFVPSSTRASKTNIKPIKDGQLDKLMALEPVSYTRAEDVAGGPVEMYEKRLSFIAEDVLPVVPEAVAIGMEGEVLGLDTQQLLTFSMKALQELALKVQALEAASTSRNTA